jgi:hypothetical protein
VRQSPFFEEICEIVYSNGSFVSGEKNIGMLTGVFISKSSLHRMFERKENEEIEIPEKVEEMSVDGGSVCVIGDKAERKQYKAIRINGKYHNAWYKEDRKLINYANKQERAEFVVCLGDGHDGVWNVFEEIKHQKLEILDWYHLMENLYKQKMEKSELLKIKRLLWEGRIDEALAEFEEGNNFRKYLEKHYFRIVNYKYFQYEGITIGSGAVESSIKQFNNRLNLTGARWKLKGLKRMLLARAKFLNRAF